MNRLIIIGNGFDLAHGMKTSYYDFMLDYIRDCFLKADSTRNYEDELMTIKKGNYFTPFDINTASSITDFLQFMEPEVQYRISFLGESDRRGPNTPRDMFNWKAKSDFIDILCRHCKDNRWVDIENKYYDELKLILAITDEKEKAEKLAALNDAFTILRTKLEEYLSKLPAAPVNNSYKNIFREWIQKKDLVNIHLDKDVQAEKTLILTFNYTPTVDPYVNQNGSLQVNYIHGKIGDPDNPIIFGFGDELDAEYAKIESDRTKGFLKYIKSFGYFKNSNYHDLIRFIESDDFQVFTMGHSCGLSDRTMLNMIFEHDHCKSIKIFYHEWPGGNNYIDTAQEISRHFRNKDMMRRKIINIGQSAAMPQIVR